MGVSGIAYEDYEGESVVDYPITTLLALIAFAVFIQVYNCV